MNTEKKYKAIKEKIALRKLLTGNKCVELRSLVTLWYEIQSTPKNKLKNIERSLERDKNCLVSQKDRQ